jgi:hypothetical protein
MAYQAVGLGSSADDGGGDTLRSGGTKINANFVELYTALGTGSAVTSGISASSTVVTLTTPIIAEIDSGSTITLDATTDIILDADGGDIFFKDAGTTFGSATNNSGNLTVKSGTTTALTFSGANVTAAGTINSGAITSTGVVTGSGFTAGSAVIAEAELEMLDGITAGTAAANKAVVADGRAAVSGLTLTTPTIAEIDSGSTITLDATTDIILDADGGDIFFKDGGTTFGSANNNSGNLTVKSGTTTALTFSGANVPAAVTFAPLKVSAVVVPDFTVRLPELLLAEPNVVPPSLKKMSPPSASKIISVVASNVMVEPESISAITGVVRVTTVEDALIPDVSALPVPNAV